MCVRIKRFFDSNNSHESHLNLMNDFYAVQKKNTIVISVKLKGKKKSKYTHANQ